MPPSVPYDPDNPTGGSNFNPGIEIDLSHVSPARPVGDTLPPPPPPPAKAGRKIPKVGMLHVALPNGDVISVKNTAANKRQVEDAVHLAGGTIDWEEMP